MTLSVPGYRAVDLPESRSADIMVLDSWAFPTTLTDEQLRALPLPLPGDRTRGVETADGELVAMHSSYPFSSFPVPGGRAATAGLTWVGVHPGHRRRGLLRSMISEHFERSLARGECLSALFAAEMPIYGRFGFGLAAHVVRLRIPRGAELRDVPGAEQVRLRVERLDADRHGPVIEQLHGRVDRPGWATRETAALREVFLIDPEPMREGAESERVVVAELDGEPVGYALFRRVPKWEAAGPRGVVRVRDLVATGPAVARALWGVLTDLDLTATVEASVPVDDALLHLLVDLRAAEPHVGDNVWVRMLDVPRALTARRYSTEVDVVLEVTDALLPANAARWHLVGGPAGAQVRRTEAPAALTLDVRELGAAYLGGVSLTALAAAGLVHDHDGDVLTPVATAFGWPVAPACSWMF